MTTNLCPRSVRVEDLERGMTVLAVGPEDDEFLEESAHHVAAAGEYICRIDTVEVSREDGTVLVKPRGGREASRYPSKFSDTSRGC